MGTCKPRQEYSHQNDPVADWDPRRDDYMDRHNSSILGTNFTRTTNLARTKEAVSEPHGLYVRNIPLELSEGGLRRMLSEHGTVLSVYIGKPKSEFAVSKLTWGIVKVETIKDAVSIIAALNGKLPYRLKVELALTEEQRMQRKQDKETERQTQIEMEELVSNRAKGNIFQNSTNADDGLTMSEGAGRGKRLSAMAKKVGVVNERLQVREQNHNSIRVPLPSTDSATSIPGKTPFQKIVIETNVGNVYVRSRMPRPCVADGCSAMGQLRCSVCKAYYCSKTCQVDDWYYHSTKCRPPPPLQELEEPHNPVVKEMHYSEMAAFSNRGEGSSEIQFEISDCNPHAFKDFDLKSISSKRQDNKERRCTYENGYSEPLDQKCHSTNGLNKANFCDLGKSPHDRSRIAKSFGKDLRQPLLNGKEIANSKMISMGKENMRHSESFRDHPTSSLPLVTNKAVSKSSPVTLAPARQLRKPETAPKNFKSDVEKLAPTTQLDQPVAGDPESANVAESESVTKDPVNSTMGKMLSSTHNKFIPEDSTLNIGDFPALVDQIEINSEIRGVITVKKSIEQFHVLILAKSADLLLSEAHAHMERSVCDPNFEPKIGSMVAAKSMEDANWYRAYIYGIVTEFYMVMFIDFGNTEKVKMVKNLPSGQFSDLSGLAMVAKLHGDINDAVRKQLEDFIVENGQVAFKVLAKKSKTVKVSLMESDNGLTLANYILRPWHSALPQFKDNAIEDNMLMLDSPGSPSAITRGCKLTQINGVNHDSVETTSKLNGDNFPVSPSKFIKIMPQPPEGKSSKSSELKVELLKSPDSHSVNAKTVLGSGRFVSRDLVMTYLNPNEEYDVLPMWVSEDNQLYVHIASEAKRQEGEELLHTIAKHCEKADVPSSYEVGELVCGYVESDAAWYRAEVNAVESNHIRINLIDFGNLCDLSRMDIRSFSVDLMKLPVAAVKIKLDQIDSENAEAKEKLISIVKEGKVLQVQSASNDPLVFNIYDNGVLLNSRLAGKKHAAKTEEEISEAVLCDKKHAAKTEEEISEAVLGNKKHAAKTEEEISEAVLCDKKQIAITLGEKCESRGSRVPFYEDCDLSPLPLGNEVELVVVHISGPLAVFVVAKDALPLYIELEELNSSMKNYCENLNGSLYRPQQGEMCLAKFSEDNMWYRAACLEPGLDTSLLLFVDYGNTEVVNMSGIRPMRKEFLKVPCIAHHCILKGVSQCDVSEDATPRLAKLLPQNSPLTASVTETLEGGVFVIDIPSVTKVLIGEGHVKAE